MKQKTTIYSPQNKPKATQQNTRKLKEFTKLKQGFTDILKKSGKSKTK